MKVTSVPTFIDGLDTVFTKNIVDKGKSIQTSGSRQKNQRFRNSNI